MRKCCLSYLSYTAFGSIYSETDRQTDKDASLPPPIFLEDGVIWLLLKKGHYYKILVGERENKTGRQTQTDRQTDGQIIKGRCS